jgi:hypothetical protein
MSEIGFSIEADSEVIQQAQKLAQDLGGETESPTAASAAGPLHSPLQGTLIHDLLVAFYLFKTAGAAVDFIEKLRKLTGAQAKSISVVSPQGERRSLESLVAVTTDTISAIGRLPD